MKISVMLILMCLAILCSFSLYGFVIDGEFQTESDVVPDGEMTPPAIVNISEFVYSSWRSAGSNAVIDSVYSISVVSIPDSMTYESGGIQVPIPNAQPEDGYDNSATFSLLITWLKDRDWLQGIHAEIYIPSGTYHFRDQIVLASNISLKGDGSDETELIFLIDADPSSTNMTESDCKKDAILMMGFDDAIISKAGIEDLKITREDGGRPHDDI